MKTAHQFARELLSLPDLPIFHLDPSLAKFCDEESNHTLGEPVATVEETPVILDEAEELRVEKFITISGDQPTDMEEGD